MTFFNWNQNNGTGDSSSIISSNIWIYFTLTGVFTFITLALFWHFILRRQRRNKGLQQQDSSSMV